MTSREQLQDTLCKRLFWHTAERDDGKVSDYLFHRHEMDVVYAKYTDGLLIEKS